MSFVVHGKQRNSTSKRRGAARKSQKCAGRPAKQTVGTSAQFHHAHALRRCCEMPREDCWTKDEERNENRSGKVLADPHEKD